MQSGAARVAAILKKYGVNHLFVLSGGHIAPVFVEAKKAGIKVTDVRDEKNAVFAADAYARLSGIPGVAAVTAGPGLTNSITAVKNAQMAQSPVIILGGATATILKGRGSLQDIDQAALMKPHVKWMCAVKKLRDIIPAMENAFRICREEVPGPVFVELPVDILYEESITREFYLKDLKPARNSGERIQNWYIKNHLEGLFRGAGKSAVSPDRDVPEVLPADAYHLDRAIHHLQKSERPVFIIGSQAMLYPDKTAAMFEALEKLNAPVYLSGMARGLLGKNHSLLFRHKRKEAIKNADLVFMAGVPADFRLDYGRQIKRNSFYISANRSRRDLLLNRHPDLAVQADPCAFIISLGEKIKGKFSDREAWLKKMNEREMAREKEIEAQGGETEREREEGGINPVALFRTLETMLPEDAILVADGGDFVATAAYILKPGKPLSWLDPGAFGTLGVGGGFAMGAKCLNPDKEVWIIWGDGSCAFSLSEFDSMARQGLPVIGLVGNDGAWGQILRDQITMLGDGVGSVLAKTHYDEVAKGYGGDGVTITDLSELKNAIMSARESVLQGKPFLINAMLSASDFRKGSISM